jgi:apolipoprotein N-acyltransferase
MPLRYVLAALSGALYFLGFAGFDLWPLAFVALVPLLWALDPRVPLRTRDLLGLGACAGFVMNVGGYYWIVHTLREFSGFPLPLCLLFAAVVWLYQSLTLACFALLYRWQRRAGLDALVAAGAAMCFAEWAIPLLFEHYFGASLHGLPLAIQVADLGGPLLVTGLLTLANAGIYVLLRSWLDARATRRAAAVARAGLRPPSSSHAPTPARSGKLALREPLIAAALWGLTLLYGAHRIYTVDAQAARAPTLTVGTVQTNMGLFEKRDDPQEGWRRHLEQSLELTSKRRVDLLVWPESAFNWFIPEGMHNVSREVLGDKIHVPTLFGGLSRRLVEGKRRPFNTAFMTDAQGNLVGSYDKIYLLAFGEYLPLGETFPVLYEWSPNSGNFAQGQHRKPLLLGEYRISVLICYEDILPNFVRGVVKEANPQLFVNLSNDAWFGDSHEPWEHLALAKFRAVEHHRALVRSTNSGVSAMIDPVGRVLAASGVFTRENLAASLPLLDQNYLYETVGDFPAALALGALALAAWRRRKRPRQAKKRAS